MVNRCLDKTKPGEKPIFLLSSVFLAVSGQNVVAQGESTGAEQILEEVVITARRREESLQSIPMAVSAYSGESLEYRGIERLDEISRFAPNLSLGNNPSFGGASNSAAIYMRGIGQKEFLPTTEPGVGLYVDSSH